MIRHICGVRLKIWNELFYKTKADCGLDAGNGENGFLKLEIVLQGSLIRYPYN